MSYVHDKCVLSNFEYTVSICKKNKKIVEVLCKFTCNDKPVSLPIYYPRDFRKTDKAFIKRAEALIDILVENKRLFKFAKSKTNSRAAKYDLEIPTSKGFYGFVSLKSFTKEFYKKYNSSSFNLVAIKPGEEVKKIDEESANLENEEPPVSEKKRGAGPVVLCVLSVLIACVGIAGALYHLRHASIGGSNDVAVTFDAGEGIIDKSHSKTITVKKNTKWKDLTAEQKPSPTFDGHVFKSWVDKEQKAISDDFTFTDNSTMLANYSTNQVTITVSPGEGSFEDGTTESKKKTIDYNTKWGSIANEFKVKSSAAGKHFSYFAIDDKQISDDTPFTKDVTLTAKFEGDYPQKIIVTFNAGSGHFGSDTSLHSKSVTVYPGTSYSDPAFTEIKEGAIYEGHTFTNWYIGTVKLDDTYTFNNDTNVTAYYDINNVTLSINPNGGTFKNGKTVIQSIEVKYGSTWSDFKKSGVYEGYTIATSPENKSFDKWKVSTKDNIDIYDNFVFDGKTAIIAEYKENEKFNVTFDAGEGSWNGVHAKTISVYKDSTFESIKLKDAPSLSGYTFFEWTKADGTDVPTTITENITVKATYNISNVQIKLYAGMYNSTEGVFYKGETGKETKYISLNPEYGSKWKDIKSDYLSNASVDVADVSAKYFYESNDTTKMPISDDTIFTNTSEITLSVYYEPTTPTEATIFVDPNGGKFKDGSEKVKTQKVNTPASGSATTWGSIKADYEIQTPKSGYTFKHFAKYDSIDTALADTDTFANSTLILAVYESTDKTITIDATSYGTASKTTITTPYNTKWSDIKSQVSITPKDGYEFSHFINATTKATIDDNTLITDNVTFTAKYNVTVTFDPNGGTVAKNFTKVLAGTTWKEIKDNNDFIPTGPEGKKFKVYQYNTGSGYADISESYSFNKSETLKASYDIANPVSFLNDTWEVFSSVMNKGFTFASTKTHVEGGYKEDFEKNKNSFVGLTRKVKLDNVDYEVRVIGQNVDTYGKDAGVETAAVTFEFTNIVDTYCFDSVKQNENTWHTSALHSYLNGSFLNRIQDSGLKDNLKSINKTTYHTISSETEDKYVTSEDNKMFILSAKEMGFEYYPDYESVSKTAVKDEGTLYDYYSKKTDDLRKKTFKGSADYSSYWLRSPDILTIHYSWNINEDGKLGTYNEDLKQYEPYDINYSIGYAPAFCI